MLIVRFLCVVLFGMSMLYGQTLNQLYIHTDRSIYSPGDTVWFKGYILKGNKLDSTISNLYIDWSNERNEVLTSNVYVAAGGYTFSQFVISSDYKTSQLFLRAYTGNMQGLTNLGYYKSLSIVGDMEPKLFRSSPAELSIKVEGDQLVEGLVNSIYFRGEDKKGNPFGYTAEILDQNYDTIARVESDSLGLAKIMFVPGDGDYMVRWTDRSNTKKIVPLVRTKKEGLLLTLLKKNHEYHIYVQSSPKSLGVYKLVGRLNQEKVFEHDLSLKEVETMVKIPAENLHFGLLQISLSNGVDSLSISEVVESERSWLTPKVMIVERRDTAKGKQAISILLPDVVDANLSVSIHELDSYSDQQDHMFDAVLGYQGQYKTRFAPQNRDLTMWSKTVSWADYSSFVDTMPVFQDQILFPKGKVLMSSKKWKEYDEYIQKLDLGNKKSKFLFDNKSMSVGYRIVRDDTISYRFVYDAVVMDKERNIALKNLQFFDTLEFKVSHVHRWTQYAEVDVNMHFKPFEDHKWTNIPSILVDTLETSYSLLQEMKEEKPAYYGKLKSKYAIAEVVIKRKVKRKDVIDRESLLMVSDLFKRSIEDYLPEENKDNLKYSYSIYTYLERAFGPLMEKDLRFGTYVLGYINETAPDNRFNNELDQGIIGFLKQTDVSQLGLVKVLDNGKGKELALYLLAPENINREYGRQIPKQKLMGYVNVAPIHNQVYKPRQVYEVTDSRVTLYWHPLIQLNSAKTQEDIIFYNNDHAKGYWITIKGVTADGRLVDYKQKVMF